MAHHKSNGIGSHAKENELVNEKDEREGKPVARQLAPMISKFIRAQWESQREWKTWTMRGDSSLKRPRNLITYGVSGRGKKS